MKFVDSHVLTLERTCVCLLQQKRCAWDQARDQHPAMVRKRGKAA